MRRCACGQVATTRRCIGGIVERRCGACTAAALEQEQADIATAIAAGATWLVEARWHGRDGAEEPRQLTLFEEAA